MFINPNYLGTPRFIIRYDKFVLSAYRRLSIMKDRMMKSNVDTSPPLVFIKSLLQYMTDPQYLTKDMFDLYTQNILSDVNMISRKFDSTQSGVKQYFNLFIKDSTDEFLLPTNGIIGSSISVLDSWDKWKNVQPIRLVAHDSRELNLEDYGTQLVFKNSKPSYAVICIDTAALLVKYIMYLKHKKLPIDNEPDEFILHYVLPYIYDDMMDVWTTNFLLDILEDKPIDHANLCNILNPSELDNAASEIKELVSRYKAGTLKLGDMVRTMFYMKHSVLSMFNLYEDQYSTYMSNRYIGPELIKMSGVLSIFIKLLELTIDRQQETFSIRKIRLDIDILYRKNWRSYVRNLKMIEEVTKLVDRAKALETDIQLARYRKP